MKKVISFISVFVACFAFLFVITSCDNSNSNTDNDKQQTVAPVEPDVEPESSGETKPSNPNDFTFVFSDSTFIYNSVDKKKITGLTTLGKSKESIIIPNSVTIIGDEVFEDCSLLKSVVIGESVQSIGDEAFRECTSLTSITIPNSVTSIGNRAFYNCTSLTSITIPDSVTSIGWGAFYNCPIETAVIPSLALYIVSGNAKTALISVNNLKTLEITSGEIISNAFFYADSLTSVVIGDSVTSIGEYAFYNCSSLTDVEIGNGVTSIGSNAFSSCDSLTNVVLGDSVTSIGEDAFDYCDSIRNIYYNGTTKNWFDISFESSPMSYAKKFYILDENGDIEYNGKNYKLLTEVVVPNTLTSFSDYHSYIFYRVKDVYYDGTIEDWCNIKFSNSTSNPMSYAKNFYILDENGDIEYNGKNYKLLTELEIPSTVTTIGNYQFYGFNQFIDIMIPDSVTSIEDNAFCNCTSLTSITIANTVTSIGDGAFANCSSLTSITIPDSVTSLGWGPFSNCPIETAIIPSLAYDDVSNLNLKEVIITSGEIFNHLFEDDDLLTTVIIGNGVTNIGSYAFKKCSSLTNLTIGNGVTNIGSYAFENCSSLQSITIPDSVTSIEDDAFCNCTSLTSITIANTVTSIGGYAFYDCTSLTNVYYNGTIEDWCNIPFGDSYSNPMYYAKNFYILDENGDIEYNGKNYKLLTELEIPSTVTSIGNYQFYGFNQFIDIMIPNSVISIGVDAFYRCSIKEATIPAIACAFINNSQLEKVILTSGNEIPSKAFYNCSSLRSITIPNSVISIGVDAFYHCSSLTNVEIGNGVTSIGIRAFYICTSLTSITIPDSVTSIGGAAFSGCISLTNVEIGNGVTSIGGNVFNNCRSLTSITIPDSVTSIESSAFTDCYRLVEVINKSSLIITLGSKNNGYIGYYAKQIITDKSDSKLSTDENGFTTYNDGTDIWLVNYIGNSTEIVIPNNVTKINDYAFYNCSSLTSITIPNGVTGIGERAFYNCSSLTTVVIGDSVTSIGKYAFYGCSIKEATIPAIACAFINTSQLEKVILTSGNKILKDAFVDCDLLTSITISDSVTSIEDNAFRNCTSLTSLTIPNSVASIGGYAFGYCNSLTSIIIPDSVTSIGWGAFYNCSSLTNVYYDRTNNTSYIGEDNQSLTSATWYYFTSNGANETASGNWWYYDTDGITIIEKVIS